MTVRKLVFPIAIALPGGSACGDESGQHEWSWNLAGLAGSELSVHWADLARMYFVAGGVAPLSIVLYVVVRSGTTIPRWLCAGHNLLLAAIVAWLWFYFLLMIPNLGAIGDVDLFFATYIVTAFFVGHCLDAVPNIDKRTTQAMVFGNAALSFYVLSELGIEHVIG
jgi:hypothetical protein